MFIKSDTGVEFEVIEGEQLYLSQFTGNCGGIFWDWEEINAEVKETLLKIAAEANALVKRADSLLAKIYGPDRNSHC